ncbi:MAG TPA: hypothetical protein VFE27_15405 [Acidobacteriaceae bacterium]|jgi:hypothetical protein|nr:hypothetical protein [Acidobacteriaceae bacterium]
MKRNLIAALSLVSFLFTATGAYAQPGMQANVPFAFHAGKAQLPAGPYRISVDSVSNRITVQSLETTAIIFSLGQQDYPGKKSDTLVFRQAGGQYFLTEVWGEQGSESMKLSGPKAVTTLEVASQPSQSGNVMIALK